MSVIGRTADGRDEAVTDARAEHLTIQDDYTSSPWPEVTANITPLGPQLVRGAGLRVWDVDGREYLDICGQTLNLALGHLHPAVASALRDQASRIWFTSSRFSSEPFIDLSRRLVELAPSGLDSVHLKMCDGADAIETAIKIARVYTRRSAVLCVHGAWHGETIATLGMNSAHRYGLLTEFEPFRHSFDGTLDSLADALETHRDLAAVVVDPIGVSNGLFDPATIQIGLQRLRQACTATGTLLVFDEIQTFGGYMGADLFAAGHFAVSPDLICLGKSLGAGLPLAATLCRREMRSLLRYGEAEFTHGGQALAARAGLAALEFVASHGELVRRNQVAFDAAMRDVAEACPWLEFRGVGFFATFRPRGPDDGHWVAGAVAKAARNCLLIRNNHGRSVLVKPPVTIEPVTSKRIGRRLADLFGQVENDAAPVPVSVDAERALARSGSDNRAHPAWATHVACLLPEAHVRRRRPAEVAQLADTLNSIGVHCSPQAGAADSERATLTRVLARVRDDPPGRELANTVVLHHQAWVEMAHDDGLILGNRTADTAVFGRSGVVLIGLDWALDGPPHELAVFEEALAIADLTRQIAVADLAEDLRRRLSYGLIRRHGRHADYVLDQLLSMPPISGKKGKPYG
jgi:acetylornithine/succinyldiaminopimelate/putrescine aminotransferase